MNKNFKYIHSFTIHSFKIKNAVGGGVEPPTVRLAAIQILGGQPQSTSRHYIVFIPESPPPRQEGMAASFIILQYSQKTSST